ncbi:MAG: AmpG family muropeptide MFS transporter [Alphaproteobacteria bacterium]|nr:AmpG family muropeptide MFS transporter [Alphaproteobacteria bacterium]
MTVSEQSRVAAAERGRTTAPKRWSVKGWADALAVYRQPRLIAILLMGFSSGLPLALTFGTLSYWLAEIGVSLTAIGLFGLVRTSYSLKFLWSPLIDRLPIPFLTARLGRRRSWALLIQFLLALAILALGMTDPRVDPAATALAAVVVAFLSASQDIVIDAYRIELLRPEEQGAGAAATQWGYRFGLLASGAGALYAASYGGWSFAYALMAALMLVGMVTVWLTPEPGGVRPPEPLPGPSATARIRAWLGRAVVSPFYEMYERAGGLQLAAIAVFIVLFKFGDALAGSMSNPLYVELGFTKVEVATISKVYGVIATLVGVAAGGALVARIGVFRALLVGGGLQALSNLMYAVQFAVGHDVGMLTVTIAAENVTGGMASSAFVAYLSNLCSRDFTATQYALLSSLATVGLNVLSASGGALAETLGWIPFFVLCTGFCAPALLLLLWLMRRPAALTAGQPP